MVMKSFNMDWFFEVAINKPNSTEIHDHWGRKDLVWRPWIDKRNAGRPPTKFTNDLVKATTNWRSIGEANI